MTDHNLAAAERGMKSRVVELKTAAEVRNLSPSPNGAFNVVLDGRLLSYRSLLKDELFQMLGRKWWAAENTGLDRKSLSSIRDKGCDFIE